MTTKNIWSNTKLEPFFINILAVLHLPGGKLERMKKKEWEWELFALQINGMVSI